MPKPLRRDTIALTHFEDLYAARPDPWRLASSDYERAKYAATLAALPRHRYARALEIGCAIGVLTQALGDRCDDLLAIEPVDNALAEARRRNAASPWIRFASLFVPGQWPDGAFDLVVLSEVIDYLGEADVVALAEKVSASLLPGADVILVHWVGKKRGEPSEDEASDRFIAAAENLTILRQDRNADYRLDLLRRR